MKENKMKKTSILASLAFVVAALVGGPAAHAEPAFPNKPVMMVVGFPPGGSADAMARFYSRKLGEEWNERVVTENVPGAIGQIATNKVMRTKPDGYNLLFALSPFDANQDFTAIGLVALAPNVLVVNADSPIKTIDQFIEYAKANPGKLSYSTSGQWGTPHLTAIDFEKKAGVKLVHVPYQGAAPAIADLIGNHVDASFGALSSVMPHVKNGRLRALAVAHDKRVQQLPDVPTIVETIGTNVAGYTWYGILAPAGMDDALKEKLIKDVETIAHSPEGIQFTQENLGSVIEFEAGPAFRKRILDEFEYWKDLPRGQPASK